MLSFAFFDFYDFSDVNLGTKSALDFALDFGFREDLYWFLGNNFRTTNFEKMYRKCIWDPPTSESF